MQIIFINVGSYLQENTPSRLQVSAILWDIRQQHRNVMSFRVLLMINSKVNKRNAPSSFLSVYVTRNHKHLRKDLEHFLGWLLNFQSIPLCAQFPVHTALRTVSSPYRCAHSFQSIPFCAQFPVHNAVLTVSTFVWLDAVAYFGDWMPATPPLDWLSYQSSSALNEC